MSSTVLESQVSVTRHKTIFCEIIWFERSERFLSKDLAFKYKILFSLVVSTPCREFKSILWVVGSRDEGGDRKAVGGEKGRWSEVGSIGHIDRSWRCIAADSIDFDLKIGGDDMTGRIGMMLNYRNYNENDEDEN